MLEVTHGVFAIETRVVFLRELVIPCELVIVLIFSQKSTGTNVSWGIYNHAQRDVVLTYASSSESRILSYQQALIQLLKKSRIYTTPSNINESYRKNTAYDERKAQMNTGKLWNCGVQKHDRISGKRHQDTVPEIPKYSEFWNPVGNQKFHENKQGLFG